MVKLAMQQHLHHEAAGNVTLASVHGQTIDDEV